jgi:hypothetical protein
MPRYTKNSPAVLYANIIDELNLVEDAAIEDEDYIILMEELSIESARRAHEMRTRSPQDDRGFASVRAFDRSRNVQREPTLVPRTRLKFSRMGDDPAALDFGIAKRRRTGKY